MSIAVEAEAGVYGGTPGDVTKMFASARENGINVIRFFPFGILSQFTLQTAPGTIRTLSKSCIIPDQVKCAPWQFIQDTSKRI